MNWLFVSFYWAFLYDPGQVTPTTYTSLKAPFVGPFEPVTFSEPISYLPTNNIFINGTLFGLYSSFLKSTIVPLVNISIPEFSPLDNKNHLQPIDVTFARSYDGTERRLKAPITLKISIIAADYALIIGGYSLVVFVSRTIQTRRRDG